MREIPLKETTISPATGAPEGVNTKFLYSEMIGAVLANPPRAPNGQPLGFDIHQQRMAFKVLDAVDAAVKARAESVKLEEP